MVGALASWLDPLGVNVLGHALLGNHFDVILRTCLDRAAGWLPGQVRRRKVAVAPVVYGWLSMHGRSGSTMSELAALTVKKRVATRCEWSHPGPLLWALIEAFARRLLLQQETQGTSGKITITV